MKKLLLTIFLTGCFGTAGQLEDFHDCPASASILSELDECNIDGDADHAEAGELAVEVDALKELVAELEAENDRLRRDNEELLERIGFKNLVISDKAWSQSQTWIEETDRHCDLEVVDL